MQANEIVARWLEVIAETADAHAAYLSNARWTTIATGALIKVGLEASAGQKLRAAARGFADPEYGRSEYLTLDVSIYDQATWGPPLFIAEHENAADLEKIQYCAWKLLTTQAKRRVLVAYYGRKYTYEDLIEGVREVARANPGQTAPRDLIVIAAPWGDRPRSNEVLTASFVSAIVGELG